MLTQSFFDDRFWLLMVKRSQWCPLNAGHALLSPANTKLECPGFEIPVTFPIVRL